MVATTGLTQKTGVVDSMEDNWLWYLAGSFDTAGVITVKIEKSNQRTLGYKIYPELTLSRHKDVESIFGLISEYAEDNAIKFRIDELESSNRMVIENVNGIRRFLEPLMGGMIQQRERAEIMLEEVLPMFEDGSPDTKEEFMEMMEVADKLREKPIQRRRSSKYDADYFRDEWNLE